MMKIITLLSPLLVACSQILMSHLIHAQNAQTCSDVTHITDIDRDRLRDTAETLRNTFQQYRNLPVDMVFVLDSSGSVGEDFFDCEIEFVKQLTSMFSISYNLTRIAVVVFSSCDKVHTYIDYISEPTGKNKCSFKNDLSNIQYRSGVTCTGGGLRRAADILKSSSRPVLHRIAIVLTKGYTNEGTTPISAANDIRRIPGGKVFAIGMGGGVIRQELLYVAGNREDRLIMLEFTSDIAILGELIMEPDLKDKTSWEMGLPANACNDLCNEGQNCCDEHATCACATQSGSIGCACQPGYTGLGHHGSCTECEKGTFKSDYGNQECTPCPVFSTTSRSGSANVKDCFCQTGYKGHPTKGTGCSREYTRSGSANVKDCFCQTGYKGHPTKGTGCSREYTRSGSANVKDCFCQTGYKSHPTKGTGCSREYTRSGSANVKDCFCQTGYKGHPTKGTGCSREYTRSGSANVKDCFCQTGYKGHPTKGTGCSPVLCEALSRTLSPGVTMIPSNCDYVYGTVCQFVCRDTHRQIGGHEMVRCLETGQWSGSALTCRHKRRRTACDPLPPPQNGHWTCDNHNLALDTNCVAGCNSGYVLVGNRDRQCMLGKDVMGVWSGASPSCKPVTCPQLVAKRNMRIKPPQCEEPDLPYGTVCRYSCKRTYRIQGTALTRCLADGTWSDKSFLGKCVDSRPPSITCPSSSTHPADPLKNSTDVSWDEPTGVDDNSGIAPIVKSSHTPPDTFFLGETEVSYEAMDAVGLTTVCSFTITVIDNEPPRVLYCPPSQEIRSSKTSEIVIWDQPVFIDNSGHVEDIIGSHGNGTAFPVTNKAEVISYRAVDAAGNEAFCNFSVAVKVHHCPHFEPPLHGALNCEPLLHYRFCTVSCEEGYEFSQEPDVSYFCGNIDNTIEMAWLPPPYGKQEVNMPWPDCSIKYDRKAKKEMSLSYNAYGCGNREVFAEIESSFVRKFDSINSFCSGGCHVEDMYIECRPAEGSVVGRRRKRQGEIVVVNVVIITFQATYDTSRKQGTTPRRNSQGEPNPSDILAQVASNMQNAIQRNDLTLAVGSDILRPDKQSLTVSDEITYPCDDGEVLRKGVCVLCPPGSFYNIDQSECTNCGRGFYQPEYGQSQCSQCPSGTTTAANNVNAKAFTDCKAYCGPGTYSSTGLATCNVCAIGTYQPLTGRHYCHTCQEGLTTWTEGSFSNDHCTGPCRAGQYSETGLEPCRPCPRGTFQTETGQTSCISCPEGHYTHNEGVATPQFCQVVDECADFMPCKNEATCIDNPTGYDCQCMPGYFGRHCEIEIDECIDLPCKNGGVCYDKINGYTCVCPTGYEGVNCQINIDDCVNSVCDNGGECVDGLNEYTCACAAGFTGEFCQINLFDCASNPCLNDAKCVDLASNYTCCCLPGYSGRHCEYAENSCISSPCMHNGTCWQQANTFLCNCPPGYTGRRCEFEINECFAENVTCHNGGTCHDLIGGFKCTCTSRFGGPFCETELANDFDLIFPSSARPTNYAFYQTLPDLYAFTLAFWMRTSDKSNLGTPVSYANFATDGSFVDNMLTLHDYNNFILFINGESVLTDMKANEYSSWIHIAVTWQSLDGSWDCYMNGFLFNSGSGLQAGSFIRGRGSLIIGQEQDSFGGSFVRSEAFIGELSQLNIWDFRMTPTEVKRKFETCLSDDNSGSALSWYDVPYRLRGQIHIKGPSNICQRIDDCHSLPCQNNGTCEDRFRSFVCKCQDGYHGDRCEHKSQNCRKNSCLNGGSCHDNGGSFFCTCLPAFTGKRCEVPVDLCFGVYCLNDGNCRQVKGHHRCVCPKGYAGEYCEYDVDECLDGNGDCDHSCHNTHGLFHCSCFGGFALQSDEKTCLSKAFCLHHGQFHLKGETWHDGECSECSCKQGRAVCRPRYHRCPQITCRGNEEQYMPPGACCSKCIATSKTCSVSRTFGFNTFDHKEYTQLGDCRYVLSEDYVSSAFSIEIEFEDKDFMGVVRRMLIVHAGCVDVTVDFDGNVQVAGITVELPYIHGNPKAVEIWRNTTFSERDVFIKTDQGVRIHWTMLDAITLDVPRSFSNDLLGLCGNMNGDRDDDMLTRQFLPGRSLKEFMHSWKVNGYQYCKSLQETPEGPAYPPPEADLLFEHLSPENLPACQGVSQALLQAARDTCNTLRGAVFQRCHRTVSIETYYELCLQDVCSCRSNEPCYCQALTAYTRECQRNRIRVGWTDSACTISCPVGMLYDHCGPACLETCTSNSQSEWCRQQPCRPRCQCPAGNVLQDGNCIARNSCPVI